MKKCNCPECGKELIRLEPFEQGVYEFWCDDCNINISISDKKELKFEDITKLEATKLFKDLGYEPIELPCLPDQNLKIRYQLKLEDSIHDEKCIMMIFYNNNIEIDSYEYSFIGGYMTLSITPFLYPITKLLEELQIDIKQVYFNEVKGGNNG